MKTTQAELSIQITSAMKQDIEDHYRDSPEYALDRYIMALLHFREHYPDAELPPFIGDATLQETLDSLPDKVSKNVIKMLVYATKEKKTVLLFVL